MMNRWSRALGQVYEALAWMACAMLFALMLVICADVFLRNVPLKMDLGCISHILDNIITEDEIKTIEVITVIIINIISCSIYIL
jgi:hypothetical protein